LLGAVLQTVTGRIWQNLMRERVLAPLAMTHSYTNHNRARQGGITALHRIWFGAPVSQELHVPPGVAPTGGFVASAGDMARYLAML
jgi:CubicO group peptidase (beta-lactamase class C family)